MAPRGRRKSIGVVEMTHDLGVSTTPVSRAPSGAASPQADLDPRRIYGDPAWFVSSEPPLNDTN
jgi:hypothetical protein